MLCFASASGPRLERAASGLGLQGKVVGMATAVEIRHMIQVSMIGGGAGVTCFTTVGCGNALSVGEPASVKIRGTGAAASHHQYDLDGSTGTFG